MERAVRARFKNGVFEPLEKLEFDESKEFLIIVKDFPANDRFAKAMGSWKGTVDFDELIRDIYESRSLSVERPEIKL
jgi:predicted DNA-binding antitoxin AbrB/MazE fold protein